MSAFGFAKQIKVKNNKKNAKFVVVKPFKSEKNKLFLLSHYFSANFFTVEV